jgi:hypothetical protein
VRAEIAAGCTAVAALVAGCNSSPASGPEQPAARSSPAILVSHDSGRLPERCGVERTASRVAAFVDAFNRGDEEQLDRLIADRDHFQWYSSVEGHGKRARTFTADGLTSAVDGGGGALHHSDERPALLRYLARRSEAGERMRLVEVSTTRIGPRGWFPSIDEEVAGVQVSIRIEAPDLDAYPGHNRLAGGKGAFGCSDGRLLAWSVGLDTAPSRRQRPLCGTRRRSRGPIIACSS